MGKFLENRVSNQEIKFAYSSEEEYLINKSIEQVEFANYQVSRQLENVLERIKDQKFEVKLFIGIFIIINIAYYLLYEIGSPGIMSAIIGSVLRYFSSLAYIIGLPICLYKVLKGIIILSTGKQSDIGEWVVEAFSLPALSSEIQSCQIYIQKYKLILEDLELWKENLADGIPVDKTVIENRMKDVNLNPKISVVSHNFGKLKRFSTLAAIVLSVIIYCLLFFNLF